MSDAVVIRRSFEKARVGSRVFTVVSNESCVSMVTLPSSFKTDGFARPGRMGSAQSRGDYGLEFLCSQSHRFLRLTVAHYTT